MPSSAEAHSPQRKLQPEPAEESREAASPEPEAPAQRALVAQAREDLARRLSIAPAT